MRRAMMMPGPAPPRRRAAINSSHRNDERFTNSPACAGLCFPGGAGIVPVRVRHHHGLNAFARAADVDRLTKSPCAPPRIAVPGRPLIVVPVTILVSLRRLAMP
jgi:hypothetical protein